ncbi:MAG: DUF2066 domain-containing protein [Gammaproteobacteria bacterium]
MDSRYVLRFSTDFALFLSGIVLLLMGSIGAVDCARAAAVSDLYRAEVAVDSQEPAAREQAFKDALEAVLVKVTGDRKIAAQPAAAMLLASASTFVQQFGYRARGHGTTLDVLFDGTAVDAALTDGDLPVWVDERPAVLIWLAVQRGDRRYLVAEDHGGRADRVVRTVAARRGIPALFPLLDLEDRAQVDVADVLGGFDENVLQASARYDADAVVIATVAALRDDDWRANWQLYYGGEPSAASLKGGSLEAVLGDGLHFVADSLADRLAVVETAGAQGGLLMSVEGVDSLEDFARLETYLDNLALARSHRIYRIGPGYASFLLEVSGDEANIRRLIGLGDVLEAAPLPVLAPAPLRVKPADGDKPVYVRERAPALHFRMLQ